MEQRLGFATTPDGVRIGYSVSGTAGQPLLVVRPPAYSHAVHWHRAHPDWRDVLTPGRRFVWVDHRGSGTSDRSIEDYSLDALADDIESVARSLDFETVDVLTTGPRAPVAIHLAATRPALVRRMVLMSPALADLGWHSGTRPLRAGDFDKYLTLMAAQSVEEDRVEDFASFMKLCVGQDDLVRAIDAFLTYDIAADLPRVACPVLLLTVSVPAFDQIPGAAAAAASMPDAQLVMGGRGRDPAAIRHAAQLADQFLREGEPAPRIDAAAANGLSPRELEVLCLLASGNSNRQIAAALTISEATVATHIRHVLEKTGTANRTQAANWARDHGVL